MVEAGRVARIFGMDPVAVLRSTPFEYEVRVAAAQAVARDMEKEAGDGV